MSIGSLQTWSSNEFFSAAVLLKGKRPQLKIQTQKRIRYLLHYFGQNSNRRRKITSVKRRQTLCSYRRSYQRPCCIFKTTCLPTTAYLVAVLRIREILVWIRIRGSMPLIISSKSGSWIRILLFSSLAFKMPTKN